jgi:hypothetical protein
VLFANFDQLLTLTFNKLSAGSTHKKLVAVLPLLLQDPLAFTQHALAAAICNQGQITVVVKVRFVVGFCCCFFIQILRIEKAFFCSVVCQ